jgi:hypothetical protein
MKKYILLLLMALLYSCEKNIENNNSSTLQAKINNSFWKSISTNTSTTTTNSLIIQGTDNVDQLTINLNSNNLGIYPLGTKDQTNSLSYKKATNNNYETLLFPSPVKTCVIYEKGTGYEPNFEASTTGGSGTGLTVETAVNPEGGIDYIGIKNQGTDYIAGDIVTISGGNSDATIEIIDVVKSNGEVIITENSNGLISGKFKFIAVNNLGETISGKEGFFYKIPLN